MVSDRLDHADLASGAVLRSAPGRPAFPVRLAEELFLRAADHLPEGLLTLWDPCCGSGYLVAVVGLRQRLRLRKVVASDADPDAVRLAAENLALLTADGLQARETVLQERHASFGRQAHSDAAGAAGRLRRQLARDGGDLASASFVADAFDVQALRAGLDGLAPDVVLTDVPYERQSGWLGGAAILQDPVHGLTTALSQVLPAHAVIVITVQARKISLPGVKVLERVRVGTRASALVRAGAFADRP
jgi:hypothetical protein